LPKEEKNLIEGLKKIIGTDDFIADADEIIDEMKMDMKSYC
jgi:hypothetical protein